MKKNITVKTISLGFVIFATCLLSGCSTSKGVVSSNGMQQNPVDLNSVIAAMQVQYLEAQSRLKGMNLTPVSAAVTVHVTNTYKAGGGISVLIFSAGDAGKTTQSSSITFDLQSPNLTSRHLGGGPKPDYSLADLIVNAATAFNNLNPTPITGLNKQDFIINVAFCIENDSNLGITFKLFDQGAGAGVEYDRAVAHELKLVFKIGQ